MHTHENHNHTIYGVRILKTQFTTMKSRRLSSTEQVSSSYKLQFTNMKSGRSFNDVHTLPKGLQKYLNYAIVIALCCILALLWTAFMLFRQLLQRISIKPPRKYSPMVKAWATPLTPFGEAPLIQNILATLISRRSIYFDEVTFRRETCPLQVVDQWFETICRKTAMVDSAIKDGGLEWNYTLKPKEFEIIHQTLIV